MEEAPVTVMCAQCERVCNVRIDLGPCTYTVTTPRNRACENDALRRGTLTLLRAVVELGGFSSRYNQGEREKRSATPEYRAL